MKQLLIVLTLILNELTFTDVLLRANYSCGMIGYIIICSIDILVNNFTINMTWE